MSVAMLVGGRVPTRYLVNGTKDYHLRIPFIWSHTQMLVRANHRYYGMALLVVDMVWTPFETRFHCDSLESVPEGALRPRM